MEPDLERELRKIAKKTGKSLNRVILDMIYQHTGLFNKVHRRTGESLGKLAGVWTKRDASEFMKFKM